MNHPIVSHPARLDRSRAVLLCEDLAIQSLSVDEAFWAARAQRPELTEGRVLSVFEYTGDWTWWERHPSGDELVYLLAGNVELLLDSDESRAVVALSPGTAAVVPKGTWHSARVMSPSTALFVTPTPARTEHRDL